MKLIDLLNLFQDDQVEASFEIVLWDGTNRKLLQVDGIDYQEKRIILTTTDFYEPTEANMKEQETEIRRQELNARATLSSLQNSSFDQ